MTSSFCWFYYLQKENHFFTPTCPNLYFFLMIFLKWHLFGHRRCLQLAECPRESSLVSKGLWSWVKPKVQQCCSVCSWALKLCHRELQSLAVLSLPFQSCLWRSTSSVFVLVGALQPFPSLLSPLGKLFTVFVHADKCWRETSVIYHKFFFLR